MIPILGIFLNVPIHLFAQVSLEVEIVDGEATTTCTDIFSNPDPFWQVNIENQGWQTYPLSGVCFNSLPNVQWAQSFNCPNDLPSSVLVCFKAFEDDRLFGCDVVEACAEEICKQIPIQNIGSQLHRIELNDGLASDGWVEISINIVGSYVGNTNDRICDAIDLGLLNLGSRIGDASLGGFDNICGTPDGDPNPKNIQSNGWDNDAGVWFTFESGPNPSGLFQVRALNDPLNTGDPINLQVAVFESSLDTCTGNLTLLSALDLVGTDAIFVFECPKPDTRYFLLVDGSDWDAPLERGQFGIELIDPGIQEGGDKRCDAIDLGPIPDGGSVPYPYPVSNFCASAIGDPPVSGFVSQRSVFFRFEAPPSGHVLIQTISDNLIDPIGTQLALYTSHNDLCSGLYVQHSSSYDNSSFDESMELSCLVPGKPYFLLVDGDGNQTQGIFTITVSDLGDDTPITNQQFTLCDGEFLTVGNNTHDQTGTYVDTLLLAGGCDSVVISDLTVLSPISLTAIQLDRATREGSPSGTFEVQASGGAGNYTYLWSNGTAGNIANNLIGGDTYCVTVVDQNNCFKDTCVFVEFITPILPVFSNTTVRCSGGNDGEITFSVSNGESPYIFTWQSKDIPTLLGNGVISIDHESVTISNLPAGIYDFSVIDVFTDTFFSVEILEPDAISLDILNSGDASCFGFCDGVIEINAEGGVGGYKYNWSNGSNSTTLDNLCAGIYILTVTDANQCEYVQAFQVVEPSEFIASPSQVKPVSCFGGANGIATVSTNGTPVSYEWNNGNLTETNENLVAGIYIVTVTNQDGCEDIEQIIIEEPDTPVEVALNIDQPIICHGEETGALSANISGPGQQFQVEWNEGSNSIALNGLGTGWYLVEVQNENACLAIDSIFLDEPELIETSLQEDHPNCLELSSGGGLEVLNTEGGVGSYLFSLDGVDYSSDTQFDGLFPGVYELIVQDALGCEKQFPFQILSPPDVSVSLGSDQSTVVLGDILQLNAQTNTNDGVFEWSYAQLDCDYPSCSQVSFQPLEDIIIEVTVTDSTTFCYATDRIKIDVVKEYDVFIPTAFSPNYDGINDYFTVYSGSSVSAVKTFRVFDRYGSLVFEKNNMVTNVEMEGWDGSWKGKQLDIGVYVWLAEVQFIDGAIEIFKGDISIIR